jgi:tetratricopeptide (TPR) repeat protein
MGCSAGKALVMGSPAKKHSPAEQLAHVAEAYEARGDYNSAAEVYNQALALNPGNRKLERQLADVQRLARGEDPVRDPFQQLRRESSELASARRKGLQNAQSSVRAVSAPAVTRLQQLRKNSASVRVEEPADWNSDDEELDGLSDEELMGMESSLR